MNAEPSNDSQEPREPRPGALGVTTPVQIMASVLSGAVLGYFLLVAFNIFNAVPPAVPWSVPIVLIAISIPVFWYTRVLNGRLERSMVPPEEGVRAMILGKSMLMTGCILAGGHLVYVLRWIGQTDVPGPRDRVIHGSVTIVTAIVFALVGAHLEKTCVVDGDDSDTPGQPA